MRKYRIKFVPAGRIYKWLLIVPYFAKYDWYVPQVKKCGIWFTIEDYCSESEAYRAIDRYKERYDHNKKVSYRYLKENKDQG